MYELILKNIAECITLSDEERDYFISLLKPKKLRRRQYIVQAGDPCKYECFINKGCLRQYYVDEVGQEHVIMFAEEGWWISDMFGLVTGNAALTNVEALEDSTLIQIDYNTEQLLMETVPKFEKFFRIITQRSFAFLQQRMLSNLSKSAEERYEEFIHKYPRIVQKVPQYALASYLGMSTEYLSKLRNNKVTKKS